MATYVISYINERNRTTFVRWYKDGRKWVKRLHAETATHYTTFDDAKAHIPPDLRSRFWSIVTIMGHTR